MKVGVSTACLYPLLIETSLKKICDMGIKNTEIFFNTVSELSPNFVKELRKIADDGGVKIVSVHPFTSGYEPYLIFSGYKRRFDDTIEFYKRYCEAANILGADILVLHGDKNKGFATVEHYCECYARLYGEMKKQGVILAQENVNKFKSSEVSFIKKMNQILGDDVKYLLDLKQVVRSGGKVFEFIEEMYGKIVHIQISDNDSEHDCLPPGSGTFDYIDFFEKISPACSTDREVSMIIELYRGNYDKHKDLEKCFDTLSNIYNDFLLK